MNGFMDSLYAHHKTNQVVDRQCLLSSTQIMGSVRKLLSGCEFTRSEYDQRVNELVLCDACETLATVSDDRCCNSGNHGVPGLDVWIELALKEGYHDNALLLINQWIKNDRVLSSPNVFLDLMELSASTKFSFEVFSCFTLKRFPSISGDQSQYFKAVINIFKAMLELPSNASYSDQAILIFDSVRQQIDQVSKDDRAVNDQIFISMVTEPTIIHPNSLNEFRRYLAHELKILWNINSYRVNGQSHTEYYHERFKEIMDVVLSNDHCSPTDIEIQWVSEMHQISTACRTILDDNIKEAKRVKHIEAIKWLREIKGKRKRNRGEKNILSMFSCWSMCRQSDDDMKDQLVTPKAEL